MTIKRRIFSILISVIMIFISVLMILHPDLGILIAAIIFATALVVVGLRFLFYYLGMGRYSVGGKTHLFFGIIILDFGLFTLSILMQSSMLIVVFLQAFYGISGAIAIVRAREAKKSDSPLWLFNMLNGVINIAIMVMAFICGNFYQSNTLLTYIFAIGLIYMAIARLISALRKTAVVYVQ